MKPKLIHSGLLFALYSTLIITSCSKGSDGSGYGSGNSGGDNNTPPAANTVTMSGMRYSVSSLSVKSGTTVTWTNNDNMSHTVTADDGSFNSGTMKQGDIFKHTFSGTGTYPYHCTFHSGMKANVVVNY